jgi:tetratricopeptide (TPR) repeat protein
MATGEEYTQSRFSMHGKFARRAGSEGRERATGRREPGLTACKKILRPIGLQEHDEESSESVREAFAPAQIEARMLQANNRARRYRKARLTLAACLALLFPVSIRPADTTSPAETLRQVQQLIQQGDLSAARHALTRALRDFPKEAGFYNLLGVVEAQQGNYRAAESNFKKAIAALPRFAGAYLNLGRLYQENTAKDAGAWKKGLETYEKLLAFQPDNVEANYQSAVLLLRRGSYRASLERLSRLPAADLAHPQALSIQCADYAGLGKQGEADAAAGRLLQSPGLSEVDILSLLPTLAEHHREDLAGRLLEGLAGRQLASFDSWRALGLLYERQGKLDRARDTLEKAGQLQPNSVPLLLELARVANRQQDRTAALGYLAHARELEPQNAGIHFFWGMVCIEQNLAEEAYRSLKKAVSLEPNNGYYNYALGAVAMQREEASEAIPYFRKYCELKPQDPRGRLALGAAYFNSHDNEEARKEISAIAQYPETAAAAHYYLGRLANQDGDFPAAVRELQLALKANPAYADAYAELGLLHLKQREYAQAEQALQKSLELNPEGYTANLNLMILYQRIKDARADAQTKRFEEVKKKRAERAKEFLRTIEVRP